MKKHKKQMLVLLIFLFLLAAGNVSNPAAYAVETSSERIVRIGYYRGDPRFQEGFSDDARKSGYAYDYYQEIASLTGWTYEYVYGSRVEIIYALLSGQVDIVAGLYKTSDREKQMLFTEKDMDLRYNAADAPYYFAVNLERTDLLDTLNQAIQEIYASNPKFTVALYQKYYGENTQIQVLTDQEQAYLAEAGSLTFGYVLGNLPLSDRGEDGNPTGVAGVVLSHLLNYLQIPLQSRCYDTVDAMEDALRNGEIDVAFPVYSDLWLTESKKMFQTEPVVSDRVMIVYTGKYRDDLINRVALSVSGLGQKYYLAFYYPQAEKIYYDSRQDAFQAIQDGEANCMLGCASIIQRFLSENMEYKSFHVAYLEDSEDFSVGVRRSDYVLAKIMNKAILQINEATITSAMVQYSNVDTPYNLMDFIQKYAVIVISVLLFFFMMLLLIFVSYHQKAEEFKAEQAKSHAALADALAASNAASNAKTSFLSNMSHDIRTPMNGIIGMTAIAVAHIDDKARVEDCLKKITISSKHLLGLINEVLDMSKIESGKVNLNEELFNLSELMDNLLTMNKPQADAKHQDFKVHILNVSHEQVIGDSLRLQQVFTNLVSNAVKYTQEGGKIEIILSEKPSGSPKLSCYEFTVEDNGIGMSEDYIPHIFEAFTRADESRANQIYGTGLGMPIARNIIHMMEGDISVESKLGVGSKFTASLFLKIPDVENISYEDFLNLNILVVDDDQVICESACLLLSELEMKGEWVLSGPEAIACVEKRHQEKNDYFAILLDWQMPDMDGIETTREIRKRVGNDVPIIVISAYDWSSIENEAIAAGANAFIGKPLFKSRLIHLFNELLNRQTPESTSGLKEMAEQSNFSGKRALLAEDNELNAEIAIEIFGMIGLEIEWAHDGKEAVQMLEQSSVGYYDCIFMDVQMPVMDGLEAARTIRTMAHPDAQKIPIFAMTANVFADDVMATKRAGMNEHIAKPLNTDDLLRVLNKYLV